MIRTIKVPDGFKVKRIDFIPVKAKKQVQPNSNTSRRVYGKWYKELYFWVVERFSNPNIFKTRRFKKAVIHSAKETGRIKREYEISACTKEAKKHMKEVDKTEGKPNTWEEDVAEGIKIVPALGKLLERLNKTKGRLKK